MRLGWSEQAVAAGQDSGDVSFLSPWIESWRQLAVETLLAKSLHRLGDFPE
jgi:hypothetical protein